MASFNRPLKLYQRLGLTIIWCGVNLHIRPAFLLLFFLVLKLPGAPECSSMQTLHSLISFPPSRKLVKTAQPKHHTHPHKRNICPACCPFRVWSESLWQNLQMYGRTLCAARSLMGVACFRFQEGGGWSTLARNMCNIHIIPPQGLSVCL